MENAFLVTISKPMEHHRENSTAKAMDYTIRKTFKTSPASLNVVVSSNPGHGIDGLPPFSSVTNSHLPRGTTTRKLISLTLTDRPCIRHWRPGTTLPSEGGTRKMASGWLPYCSHLYYTLDNTDRGGCLNFDPQQSRSAHHLSGSTRCSCGWHPVKSLKWRRANQVRHHTHN